MAGQFGFVYLIGHYFMPNVYKIGCTERSPHARMAELSSSTSVPGPFTMICYLEVREMFNVECRFHEWLDVSRITSNREFFCHESMPLLVAMFRYYDRHFSDSFNFVSVRDEVQLGFEWGLKNCDSYHSDPFKKKTQAQDIDTGEQQLEPLIEESV